MKTTISVSSGFSQVSLLNNLLITCGILSSLLYVAMNIFVPFQFPGYSSTSQTVSELSAIGAPTRSLWMGWAFLYTLLVMAFAWGVWKSAGANRKLRILALLIFIYGVLGLGWPFAPMHQREILAAGGGTFSDTLHILFSIVTVSLMLLAIGIGATVLGKTFRIYSILSILTLCAFGILTGLDAPNIETNQPTPWIGVWERINIGIFLLWMVVLGVVLLFQKENLSQTNGITVFNSFNVNR